MRRWQDGRATPGQLAPRVRWQSSWLKGSRAPAGHSASMSPRDCAIWAPWTWRSTPRWPTRPPRPSTSRCAGCSNAANNSGLWFAIAAALALAGGGAGRRAALRGTLAIGATSALVNLAVKSIWARQRPDRAGAGVPVWRNVRMPTSTSFPSGHAASGFAFAAAIGRDQPWLGIALRFLAAAVGYSRVHTGVHYPGDVVVGSLIGEGTGQAVAGLVDRLQPPRNRASSSRDQQREQPPGAQDPDAGDAGGAPS